MKPWPLDYSRLDCRLEGDPRSFAVLSNCDRYRYLLGRTWDDYFGLFEKDGATRPLMVWVMLNPSKADGLDDDPTIRKCIGFAKRRGCGGILVANLFAWRETHPRNIPRDGSARGEHNTEFLGIALSNPLMAIGVGAWGAIGAKWLRSQAGRSIVQAKCARRLWCFGKTKSGEPCHPLMLAYDTPLVSMADGRPFP